MIDTDIVLDVMLKRDPFYRGRQLRDRGIGRKLIRKLLTVVSVASVTEQEIEICGKAAGTIR